MAIQGVQIDLAAGQGTTTTVEGIVNDMQTTLTRITQSSEEALALWKGNASSAFNTAVTGWHTEATQLRNALEELKTSLQTGFNGYDTTDIELAGTYPAAALNVS